jgi:hypothetical protein
MTVGFRVMRSVEDEVNRMVGAPTLMDQLLAQLYEPRTDRRPASRQPCSAETRHREEDLIAKRADLSDQARRDALVASCYLPKWPRGRAARGRR